VHLWKMLFYLGIVVRLLNSFIVFTIATNFLVINSKNVKGQCTKLGQLNFFAKKLHSPLKETKLFGVLPNKYMK